MSQSTITPTWTTGDRLRKARELAGISSIEMAEHLGVSRNTVTNYEHDNTRPPLMAIRAYAAETGVPIEWLIGEDDADLRNRCFSTDVKLAVAA